MCSSDLSDIGIANAVDWAEAWSQQRAHAIRFDGVKDGWIRKVSSFVSPSAPQTGAGAGAHLQNGGILVASSKRVTVTGCDMRLAQNRGGGGCGYLFEIMQSCEVLTRDCIGVAGRHNFIQNWGFGTTGCVWLRCHTDGGVAVVSSLLPGIGGTGYSEYHHSLATADLVDSCTVNDGWSAVNRKDWSSGAGHTATQCVFWNTTGTGVLRSAQFGWGYIIGTEGVKVNTTLSPNDKSGADPPDWQELIDRGALLHPRSLYEAQRILRTGKK